MRETPETTTCQPCAIANRAARHINDGLAAEGQQGTATHEGICQGYGCECGCVPETPETTMRPEDVPKNLFSLGFQAANKLEFDPDLLDVTLEDEVRAALAAVLPAARRMWFAELLGTPEEIAARENRPRERDDPAEICERLAPGHHEQRVRAEVAEEIKAGIGRYDDFIAVGMRRAARIARGEQP